MSGSIGNNPYRASGVVASAAGGAIDWDTSIHTSTVTAVSGKGYFVNTSGGAVTVNLPAASVGNIVALKDYAGTWDTNACTIAPNGSENIGGGSATDPTLTAEGGSVTLVYADATQGWLTTQQSVTTSPTGVETFMVASGGTPCSGAICGDYKVHTFTGPGTFCVSSLGTTNVVDYLVVAGGGGARATAAGAGAGGFRVSNALGLPGPLTSPLASPTGITVTASPYTIAVGGGGPGSPSAANGGDSTFSTITSAGGGTGGGQNPGDAAGGPGGSGGGGDYNPGTATGGTGNVPETDPDQGTDGGNGVHLVPNTPLNYNGGGGGGAGQAGLPGDTTSPVVGQGGNGSYISPAFGAAYGTTGTVPGTRYFAGGGGSDCTPGTAPVAPIPGGEGGGGDGDPGASAGGTNTGGGGGGSGSQPAPNGGPGIVIIRYKYQ